jgi:hypothetical protein
MLLWEQFQAQMTNLVRTQYRLDNQWVARFIRDLGNWNEAEPMDRYIRYAYNLYECTAKNRLKLTILGGSDLRTNPELIRDFGVTGANGIQDGKTLLAIMHMNDDYYAWRAKDEFPRGGGGVDLVELRRQRRQGKPHKYFSPIAAGGILSEKGWTPMLNDALIIGAITAGQTFHLGMTKEEGEDWSEVVSKKMNKVEVGVLNRHGRSVTLTQEWKTFFNRHREMFFDKNGIPRVFTRELLGLSIFGYTPNFHWHDLSFTVSGRRADPDFRTYLDGLRKVHFQAPTDETKVMRAVSEFLFHDRMALGQPWAKP